MVDRLPIVCVITWFSLVLGYNLKRIDEYKYLQGEA